HSRSQALTRLPTHPWLLAFLVPEISGSLLGRLSFASLSTGPYGAESPLPWCQENQGKGRSNSPALGLLGPHTVPYRTADLWRLSRRHSVRLPAATGEGGEFREPDGTDGCQNHRTGEKVQAAQGAPSAPPQ